VQESVSGGAVATGEARADQDQLKVNGIGDRSTFQRAMTGLHMLATRRTRHGRL